MKKSAEKKARFIKKSKFRISNYYFLCQMLQKKQPQATETFKEPTQTL
jgi:hypothetical protein